MNASFLPHRRYFLLPALPAVAAAGLAACLSSAPAAGEHAPSSAAGKDVGEHAEAATLRLWTCGMHPQVVQDHPGDCPICHMELVPVAEGAASGASDGVRIDPAMVQNMGLRTAAVARGPLVREVRAAGFVVEATPLVHDVSLRVDAWITRLHAHTDGMRVAAGEPLFEAYGPALAEAAEELAALRDGGRAAAALRPAVEKKLARLGLDQAEIRRLAAMDAAPSSFVFRSPAAGEVTGLNVVEGTAVAAGQQVLRIADHSTVWIDARVPERDLALVRAGHAVRVRADAAAMPSLAGEVMLVHPHVDEATRTGLVRVGLPNPAFALRPGMFATVILEARVADDALLVPREAVIDTGEQRIAFVAGAEPGRFEPRRVETGHGGAGGVVEVLGGLHEGEQVVVSGQFLLDAESRVQEALRRFIAAAPGGQGNAGGAAPAGHVHGGVAR